MADDPFRFINAILDNKRQLILDEQSEREYQPFLTNRALSQHADLIVIANKINEWHFLDKKLQFDFLLYFVPKRRRKFQKWPKKEKDSPECSAISEYYNISTKRAKEYEKLLSKEQIDFIIKSLDKGGA